MGSESTKISTEIVEKKHCATGNNKVTSRPGIGYSGNMSLFLI